MSSRTKLALVLPDFKPLGVQRVVWRLVQYLDRSRFEVGVIAHDRSGELAPDVAAHAEIMAVDDVALAIPKLRVLTRPLAFVRVLRRFDPDAVISFVPYTNVACAWARRLGGLSFGLAVSEHAHVTASLQDPEAFESWFGRYYRRSFADLYNRRADLVKCIAAESLEDLVTMHGIARERTRLVPDPIDADRVQASGREPVDHPWLARAETKRVPVVISTGRLVGQKRLDLLLSAFANVRRSRRVRLLIVGDGPWRARLEEMASMLGIREHVGFVGYQANPWRFVARSSLFALSSDWEGLPNALMEAMALGVPCVSTRCPSGPAEILLNGEAGLLCRVGDVNGLAIAMNEALAFPEAGRARAEIALKSLDRFDARVVTRAYEALANELAESAAARRRAVTR